MLGHRGTTGSLEQPAIIGVERVSFASGSRDTCLMGEWWFIEEQCGLQRLWNISSSFLCSPSLCIYKVRNVFVVANIYIASLINKECCRNVTDKSRPSGATHSVILDNKSLNMQVRYQRKIWLFGLINLMLQMSLTLWGAGFTKVYSTLSFPRAHSNFQHLVLCPHVDKLQFSTYQY